MSGYRALFILAIFANTSAVFAIQPTALFLLDAQPNIRQYSMGEIFSAANPKDAVSNPWELGYSKTASAYFSHWPGAVNESQYNFISAVLPYKKLGGFNLSYLTYGTGSETFEELDGTSRSIQLENNKVVSFGYGRKLGERFFVGGSLKYLSSTLADQYTATSLLKDFGAAYHALDDKYSFGIAVLNSGSALKYYQTREPIPTELKLGYTRKFTLPGQKVILGFSFANSQVRKSYSVGVEWFPNISFVSVRAGANKRDSGTRFSSGLGLNWQSFDFDLGYDLSSQKIEDGQSPLRFAISWYFLPKTNKPSAEPLNDKMPKIGTQ